MFDAGALLQAKMAAKFDPNRKFIDMLTAAEANEAKVSLGKYKAETIASLVPLRTSLLASGLDATDDAVVAINKLLKDISES